MAAFSSLSRGAVALGDLFFPRRCVVCGRDLLLDEEHICLDCLEDLPLTRFWDTWRNPMGDKFNALIRRDAGAYEPYSRAAALFHYRSHSGYKRIPQSLKYYGAVRQGRWFSAMLGRHLAASPYFSDISVVVPVPLHWTRRLSRGYNQAGIIGTALASELGARFEPQLLYRRRRTKTQTLISTELKAANVSGAFSVRHGKLRELLEFLGYDSASVMADNEGRTIHFLLVDDVFTTGATLAACHGALREGLLRELALDSLPRNIRISIATLGAVGCS